MNISSKRYAAAMGLIAGLTLSASVSAEIYKHVDENGKVTYSNIPMRGGKKMELEPLTTIAPPHQRPKAQSSTPANFPRVDSDTQRKRDDTRRRILEEELTAEQRLLGDSRKELAEGEGVRLGDEARNYQKYLDRVQKLKDNVTLHEKNIEALRKELTNLR